MSVKYLSKAKGAIQKINSNTARNTRAATQFYLTELRKVLLRGARTGAQYKVPGGTRRTYTASAPGEAPAPRTGRLANSYTFAPKSPSVYLVGSPLVYAAILEKGRRKKPKIAPRPHFRVTFNKNQKRIRAILNRPVL
jgi:phage gpG-like protein